MNDSSPSPVSHLHDAIAELAQRIQHLETALTSGAATATDSATTFALRESHVRRVIAARRIRNRHLGQDLAADPAWDMLLEAMAAELAGNRIRESDLCRATTVPDSTALRWIRKLESDGWVRLHASLDETRWIEMTFEGSVRLRRLFEALGSALLLA